MSESVSLIDLQRRQNEHDREHHHDVYTLPYADRMEHYTFHFTKYVGRLSRDYPSEEMLSEQVERTVADSFIIVLASANTLGLDLQQELEAMFGEGLGSDVDSWSETLNFDEEMDSHELKEYLFYELATPTGEMANALESLDHMEEVNARKILSEGTVEIFAVLLRTSNRLSIELIELVEDRWQIIEEESIL